MGTHKFPSVWWIAVLCCLLSNDWEDLPRIFCPVLWLFCFFYVGRTSYSIINQKCFWFKKTFFVVIVDFNTFTVKRFCDLGSLSFLLKSLYLHFNTYLYLYLSVHICGLWISLFSPYPSLWENISYFPICFQLSEKKFFIALFYSSPCYFLSWGHLKYFRLPSNNYFKLPINLV